MISSILSDSSDSVKSEIIDVKAALTWLDFVEFLGRCPIDWNLTPLQGKRPIKAEWSKVLLTRSQLIKELGQGYSTGGVSGIGLVFGPSSNGIIGIDHDGHSGDPWILENSKLSLADALPPTLTITSGRPGRYTKFYRVPEANWASIKSTSYLTGVKVWCEEKGKDEAEQVDFRWAGHQSVVFGVHPLTKGLYSVSESLGESGTEIAPLPVWIYPFISNGKVTKKVNSSVSAEGGGLELDRARYYLTQINPSLLEWEEWRNCLFAIHKCGIDKDEAIGWSGESEKHTTAGFNDVWDHIKGGDIGAEIGIGTLGFYAKQQGWVPKNKGDSKKKQKIDDILGIPVEEYVRLFDHSTIKFSIIGNDKNRITYNGKMGTWSSLRDITPITTFLIKRSADNKTPDSKFAAQVDRELQIYHQENGLIINAMPSLSTHHIGLADCDYNTVTNQFEDFSPDHNVWERWSLNKDDFHNPNIKQEYLDLFKFQTGSEVGAEMMYLAKCGEALKLGHKLWQMLVVSGPTRTGKTSYASSFMHLQKYNNNKINQLLGSKETFQDQFGFSSLTQNITSWHIPELQIKQADIEWIKTIVDSDCKPFTFIRKNENRREMSRSFIAYASVQDDFKLEGTDGALKNRFVHIKVTLPYEAAEPGEKGIKYSDGQSFQKIVDKYYGTPESNAELFMYILHNEKSADVIKRWQELINSDYIKGQAEKVYKTNDPLARFFEENESYQFVEDADQYITGDAKRDLIADIRKYLVHDCNYKGASVTLIHSLIAKHVSIAHPNVWILLKPKINKDEAIETINRINGKVSRYICCLTIQNQSRTF
jgi:hypothetical protein